MATATFKEHFREIKRGRPGHRFQDRYEREKNSRRKGHSARGRIWRAVVGVAAVAVGVVLCVIPGPGLPFIFIGGGLLATESKVIARGMDWLEVRGRALWRWGVRHWERLPRWGKIAIGVFVVSASAAAMYLLYRFVRS